MFTHSHAHDAYNVALPWAYVDWCIQWRIWVNLQFISLVYLCEYYCVIVFKCKCFKCTFIDAVTEHRPRGPKRQAGSNKRALSKLLREVYAFLFQGELKSWAVKERWAERKRELLWWPAVWWLNTMWMRQHLLKSVAILVQKASRGWATDP